MKRIGTVIILLILLAIVFLFFKGGNTLAPTSPVAATNINVSTAPTPTANAVIGTATISTDTPAPRDLSSQTASPVPVAATDTSTLPPATILDNARVAIHNYNGVFGENPVGNNSEITTALMGKNSKQINFITPESGLRMNDKGELIDAWGTPFFFHQLSGQEMEIRSAGPDRKMWTIDDQVTR
jgi:hypothetical protein